MDEDPNGAVVVSRAGRVATLRLNRPAIRNALNAEVKAGLAAAIPALLDDAAIGCIVLTGTAGAFCAGGNITDMQEREPGAVRARLRASHAWARRLLGAGKPLVAAVNGPAAGAGFSLAMLCDLVLVAEDAFFQAGFPALGAVPDIGLALTLPRAVGMARARELLLTNRRLGAAEAVAWGLAARACPAAALLPDAQALAQTLAAGPQPAFALTKALLAGAYGPVDPLLDAEAGAQADAFGSADFAEGVEAFLGKRPPRFGRPA